MFRPWSKAIFRWYYIIQNMIRAENTLWTLKSAWNKKKNTHNTCCERRFLSSDLIWYTRSRMHTRAVKVVIVNTPIDLTFDRPVSPVSWSESWRLAAVCSTNTHMYTSRSSGRLLSILYDRLLLLRSEESPARHLLSSILLPSFSVSLSSSSPLLSSLLVLLAYFPYCVIQK
jgi:hypothetical protein